MIIDLNVVIPNKLSKQLEKGGINIKKELEGFIEEEGIEYLEELVEEGD